MSYLEQYKVISKPWVSVCDIQIIACCGRSKATEIRLTIEKEITKSGMKLPQAKVKVIPSKSLVDYLGLDINYIYEMAIKEKSLDLV